MARRTSFEDMQCSVAQTLEVVGDWWSLLLVRDLLFGVRRFDDFRSRLGIARNVLTDRLEHLVAHGIVERRQYSERPPRDEYVLTDKGRDLWPIITAMVQWGDRWAAPDGPPVLITHTSCGHDMAVSMQCDHCGEVLDAATIRPHDGPGAPAEGIVPSR